MKNNKGVTIVELIVSIVLISIVLMFITNLYIRTKNSYKNDQVNMEYELTKSVIINEVGKDAMAYGINSSSVSGDTITINYSNGTTKTVAVTNGTTKYIKYGNVTRKFPDDTKYSGIDTVTINTDVTEYRIKIENKQGTDYTINLYIKKGTY